MTPLKRALFVVIPIFLSKTYPYTSNRNLSVQPKAAKATSMKKNTGYAFKDTSRTLGSTITLQFVYYSSYLKWDTIQFSVPSKFASIAPLSFVMIMSEWSTCYATPTELSVLQPAFQKWRITNKLLQATTTEIPLPKTTKVYTNQHIQKFPIYGTPLFANFSVFSLVVGHNKDEWYSAKLWAKIGRQSCFRT